MMKKQFIWVFVFCLLFSITSLAEGGEIRYGVTNAKNVTMYKEPNAKSAVVKKIPLKGMVIDIHTDLSKNSNDDWFAVSLDDKQGYIKATLIDEINIYADAVWIPTKGGKKHHTTSGCSNMKEPHHILLGEAEKLGFTPCKKCH